MPGKIRARHKGCRVESYEERQHPRCWRLLAAPRPDPLTVRSLRSAWPQPDQLRDTAVTSLSLTALWWRIRDSDSSVPRYLGGASGHAVS